MSFSNVSWVLGKSLIASFFMEVLAILNWPQCLINLDTGLWFYEQLPSLRSVWTSGCRSPTLMLIERMHVAPFKQCSNGRDWSKKLLFCALWDTTSASHPAHCSYLSLSLSLSFPPSLSRDELCPEDKLQWWISIIVSLLHTFCESGGLALLASKSSHICWDKQSSSFQTHTICVVTCQILCDLFFFVFVWFSKTSVTVE